MPREYKHIFFDLDHTLWDFEKNSEETLEHLYHHYNLVNWGIEHPGLFISTYRRINDAMWAAYSRGELDKQTLREARFSNALIELGVPNEELPTGIWQLYLDICPTKANLFPHALEVLGYVSERYSVTILTNGFEETQQRKLHHSGIKPFVHHLITSEKLGFAKPDRRIFEHGMALNNAQQHDVLMIGDNIETDIEGARGAGIDHVFFNPAKNSHQHDIQTEIHSLHQLMDIL